MRVLLVLFLAMFGLSACSGEWDEYPVASADVHIIDDSIHVSDVLDITVYEEDNLSGGYTVDLGGAITMPLIGMQQVFGLNAETVAKNIAAAFKKGGYFVRPDVTVVVTQSRVFAIMGEVLNAGEYPFKDGMTILDGIAKAGGFSYRADQTEFDIVRKNHTGAEDVMPATLATKLSVHDVIRVRERFF